MNNIALPKKIDFKKGEKENQGIIIVEPCYPGYGTTLGNSIRRVLLSSLPGAAVIGIKIKGVEHEFMGLPHVKEDVLEIILNIKKLRFRLFSEEIVKLELDVHGEKVIKTSDIKKNSQVEIVNPDLILAQITDMAGSLNMEIFVSRGIGYETIEGRERKQKEIGYIEIDSIYSPVLAAGINIENVRVGKMTTWDKLILNITTDGTITPEEAFKQAADILINQFSALVGRETKKEKDVAEVIDRKEEEEKEDLLVKTGKEEKQKSTETEEAKEEEKSSTALQSDSPQHSSPRPELGTKAGQAGQVKKKRGRPRKS